MDLIHQNPSEYPFQDAYPQDYKFYCQVCQFGSPYIEQMQYHYAFQCKRYFFPVISEQQQQSSSTDLVDEVDVLSYDQYETKPLLLTFSEDSDYGYSSTNSKNTFESSHYPTRSYYTSKTFQGPYDFPVDSQTAFTAAAAVPQIPPSASYFYSYPSITMPYFYFSAPAGTFFAPATAADSSYSYPSSDAYIEVEQVATGSVVNAENDLKIFKLPLQDNSDWISCVLESLSLSTFGLHFPSSSEDFSYWDVDTIEIQHFEPPLPSLIQVATEEYDFYALETFEDKNSIINY